MKYDILLPFRDYLESTCSKNTARTYYSAVVKLFKDQQFNDIAQIDPAFLEKALPERFKTRNEFSAAKNGLKRLKEYYPQLQLPKEEFFHDVSSKKRNRSRKPKKTIYLDTVQRKVNQMRNPKLKYAYRLAMISGLRVSELSALQASDIHFQDGTIFVDVKHGKGGSNGTIECLPDVYLYQHLQDYIKQRTEENLFYSEAHMRKEALSLDLECHDFRRIFAIQLKNKLKQEGELPPEKINAAVQEALRHQRFSTTKRYLYNRKLYIKPKKEASK